MSHAADASDLAKFHACCSAGSLHLDHNRRGTVGSAAVSEAEPLTVFPDAAEAAEAMLREDPDTNMRIRRVLGLTEGFDSAYGLELLATVHWVALHEHPADAPDLVAKLRGWSHRKAGMFTADHIHAALDALRDRGWLTSPVPA